MRQSILLLGLAAILVVTGPALAQSGSSLDDARSTLAKWVETQQIISKEREDWQLGREVLQQRIDLVTGEIENLESRIAEVRQKIGEANEKRADLRDEKRRLEAASAVLKATIDRLESKTRELLTRLPEPIAQRIAPLAQRIPTDPSATEASVSQRMQNVIGVLNEINKFNGTVALVSELRELPGGRTAEVRALYIGLGQAYYVTSDGQSAGFGGPSPEGWNWTEANELASQVQKAIAIYENEDVPAYVPLKVDIR